jgi:hypothetical protein
MVPYDFSWPADVSATWVFPTDYEVVWGHAGGNWIGEDADGELPLEPQIDDADDDAPYVAATRFKRDTGDDESDTDQKRTHDTGDKHPSDKSMPSTGNGSVEKHYSGQTGEIENEYAPQTIVPQEPGDLPQNQEIPLVSDGVAIDLSSTYVRDGKNNYGEHSFLSDLIHFSNDGKRLCLKDTTNIWSEDDPSAEFDFKYDEEQEVWGAKTAWLRDEG